MRTHLVRTALAGMGLLIAASCSNSISTGPVPIQTGEFDATIRSAPVVVSHGTAIFNEPAAGAAVDFVITLSNGLPAFELTLERRGRRPAIGTYTIAEEEADFTGQFIVGAETENASTYVVQNGTISLQLSQRFEILGLMQVSGRQIEGPEPGRILVVDVVYRATCTEQCRPDDNGGPNS